MPQFKYTYDIALDFLNGKVNSTGLTKEINDSTIVVALDYVGTSDGYCDVFFKGALSDGYKSTLDGIVGAHAGNSTATPDGFVLQSSASVDLPTADGLQIPEGTTSLLMAGKNSGAGKILSCGPSGEVCVTSIPGTKEYHSVQIKAAALPAELTSGNSGNYTVGTKTLTLTVNGAAESAVFPTRAATAGTSVSSAAAGTANGPRNKLKVAIDGGALTEISIAEDLTTGAAIADSLQTQIVANVPNGTGVTVDYNTTNLGRYTVTSGTTGPSSTVVLIKGRDSFAELAGLGVAHGGAESTGYAINTYSAQEVATEIASNVASLVATANENDKVVLATLDRGASKSILITAGGANDELGFSTTQVNGIDGGASTAMNVDGSTTIKSFSVPKHSSRIFQVRRLIVKIVDDLGTMKKFGGLGELTNGVQIRFRLDVGEPYEWANWKNNSDVSVRAHTWNLISDADDSNNEYMIAQFDLLEGFRLDPSREDEILFRVRDNLTTIVSFEAWAEGVLL